MVSYPPRQEWKVFFHEWHSGRIPPILKPFSIFLSVFGTIGLRNTQPFYCFRQIGYSTLSFHDKRSHLPTWGKKENHRLKSTLGKGYYLVFKRVNHHVFSTKSKRKALEFFTHLISPSLNQSVWSKKHTHHMLFFVIPLKSDTLRFCKKNTESFDTTPWQLRSEITKTTAEALVGWTSFRAVVETQGFFWGPTTSSFLRAKFFWEGNFFRFLGGILLSRSLVCWEFFAVVFFVWSPSKWVHHLRELSHNHGFFVKKWVYLPLYLR